MPWTPTITARGRFAIQDLSGSRAPSGITNASSVSFCSTATPPISWSLGEQAPTSKSAHSAASNRSETEFDHHDINR